MNTRGGGGPKGRENFFMLKFFLSCLQIWVSFHHFLWFSDHGKPLLGALPDHHLPLHEELTLPPSAGVRGSSGGLPSPPPQLCWPGPSGPGDARTLRSETLCLKTGDSGHQLLWRAAGVRAPVAWNTHRACTQAHSFTERHPGSDRGPLKARGQGIGQWGRTHRLLFHGWAKLLGSGQCRNWETVRQACREGCLGENGNLLSCFWTLDKFESIRLC